jgi:hypothetical protein
MVDQLNIETDKTIDYLNMETGKGMIDRLNLETNKMII